MGLEKPGNRVVGLRSGAGGAEGGAEGGADSGNNTLRTRSCGCGCGGRGCGGCGLGASSLCLLGAEKDLNKGEAVPPPAPYKGTENKGPVSRATGGAGAEAGEAATGEGAKDLKESHKEETSQFTGSE